MNYYIFFDIPLKLDVDLAGLKKKYYQNSKLYHPDFFTLKSAEVQAEILEKSSLNNEGYKILQDFDKRLKYFLSINHKIEEEGQNKIPQDFLMEMMEYNEQLMELEFDYNAETQKKLHASLKEINAKLLESIQAIQQKLNTNILEDEWDTLRTYFLKRQYLKRLSENLAKFNESKG